jgi:16S rRNA (guanine527-N7)-methyltransferase
MPLPYLRELYTQWHDILPTPLTDEQEEQFARYAALLQEWNAKMNLTAITDEAGIVAKHFMDSLSVLTALDGVAGAEYRVLDVGTGAGFPGIPLAIMRPHWQVTLLESTRKKVDFLVMVGNALGLKNLLTVWSRAEEAGHIPKHREHYHAVVARAVAELPVLAEYCLPFVRQNGHWVAQKSLKVDEEVAKAKNALGQLGGKLVAVKSIAVPGMSQETRSLVVVQKIKPTPVIFPRKAGLPSKKPL